MLIARHRRVTDPNSRYTKFARQRGFYMHLPRYWSCWGEDFDSHWRQYTMARTFTFSDGTTGTSQPMFDPDSDYAREAKQRADDAREAHSHCHFPFVHRSYVGYMSWRSRRRTWTWFYQGNPYRPGSNFEHTRFDELKNDNMVYHKGDLFLWTRRTWPGKRRRWQYGLLKFKRGWAERHPTNNATTTR